LDTLAEPVIDLGYSCSLLLSSASASWSAMSSESAEALASPFFGFSLFPYLAFIYFLNVPENDFPKGVTVGFAACLLFVVLTIPAAIVAKLLYGESLANCDWLHGSAESMLTITNLATVIPFRQALNAKDKGQPMPQSAVSYAPTTWLLAMLTLLAIVTAVIPAVSNPTVHTPYLNGFMDLSGEWVQAFAPHGEPENTLTVATWIIHVSSLVEFLVAMGFCWRWADAVQNPKWKGLTWGLLPLHASGITACVSHFMYNQIAVLVPLQAFLTCLGNMTAAYAAYRIARSNGWQPNFELPFVEWIPAQRIALTSTTAVATTVDEADARVELPSPMGFEDLGDALAGDSDVTFLLKLFVGCALFSYLIKYGELFFDSPFEPSLSLSMAFIAIPSALNAYKWNRRSKDPSFEGWF
jgi:hypothetical protein